MTKPILNIYSSKPPKSRIEAETKLDALNNRSTSEKWLDEGKQVPSTLTVKTNVIPKEQIMFPDKYNGNMVEFNHDYINFLKNKYNVSVNRESKVAPLLGAAAYFNPLNNSVNYEYKFKGDEKNKEAHDLHKLLHEIPHKIQKDKYGTVSFLYNIGKDLINYPKNLGRFLSDGDDGGQLKDLGVYENPGTLEFEAHKIIQPKLYTDYNYNIAKIKNYNAKVNITNTNSVNNKQKYAEGGWLDINDTNGQGPLRPNTIPMENANVLPQDIVNKNVVSTPIIKPQVVQQVKPKLTNFEQRINKPTEVIKNKDNTVSTHKMMSFEADGKYYAAPTIVKKDNKLVELKPNEAIDFAFKNNEFKEFKTDKEAKDYANNGYKKGTPLENKQQLPFENQEVYNTIISRQKEDSKKYKNFVNQGSDILNRTDIGRNKDSEKYIEDFLKTKKWKDNVIIDIGSALGNKDSKLAGVTVKELYDNKNIASKSKIIATDIPSEMKVWNSKKDKYGIDVAEVSDKSFNTDVKKILNDKKISGYRNIVLRSSNSIDLIMDEKQTLEHFKHLGKTLLDKEVTYIFNNTILHKDIGKDKFNIIGDLNNAAFDHKSADGKKWLDEKNRVPYKLRKK